MVLRRGFWHNDSILLSSNTTFKACKYEKSCASFRSGSNSTMNCSRGSEGVLCSTCLDGFSRLGDGSCVPCSVEPSSAGQVALVCTLFIALVGFLLFLHGKAKHPQDNVGLPIKIFIDFSQMLSSLSIFSVVWSEDMLNLFDTAGTANFGAGLGSVTCITLPYRTTLIINIMSPFIIFCILATALVSISLFSMKEESLRPSDPVSPFPKKRVRVRELCAGPEGLQVSLARAVMVVMFLTYASVTSAAMNFFHCDVFGDHRRLLVADYSLDCDSDDYKSLMPWAILGWMITVCVPLFWGMGILVLAKHSRWRKHLKFTSKGNRGRCYRVAGSMYAPFLKIDDATGSVKHSQGCDIAVAWEAVRMARKAGLIALSVFYSLPEYRSTQLCLGLVWLNLHMSIL